MKITKALFGFILLLSNISVYAQKTEGIRFAAGSWNELLQKATQENKPIFVDCYTSWCVPCKKLALEVFPLKSMGEYFNANFICAQMDMEKGVGKELCVKYEISSFPTMLILDSKGFKIGQLLGLRSANDILSWAKETKDKPLEITPEVRIARGERDEDLIRNYFNLLLKEGKTVKARETYSEIYKKDGPEILSNKLYWDLLAMVNVDSAPALYLVQHRSDLVKVYGESVVNKRIREIYITLGRLRGFVKMPASLGVDSTGYQNFIKRMDDRKLPDRDFLKQEIDFYVACSKKDYPASYVLANEVMENKNPALCLELLQLANWEYTSKEPRIVALKWAKQVNEMRLDAEQKVLLEKVIMELETKSMGTHCHTPIVWGNIIF